ncbi:hypothetical protein [Novosphingobium lindaniclasticum]|uniref:Uncharacterized protein n=1 Tax=Novosphingobium lindaniclasticum LE124 TaxID=1096930 RepID=T0JCF6_9SPHN|nr:hypothetical protein [Novosphingobium lindaniclasticum]EQB19574.1 hypothetical protein L284_01295 [Novosphingobium lindaniclasticum LE124]
MALYDDFPQGVLTPGFLDGAGQSQAPASPVYQAPQFDTAALDSVAAQPLTQASPQFERPGFLRRIKQQPGGSKALLAFGAGLLSSQNFFDGLGKGAMAYQNTLDAEAEKLKPQLTKDAAFSYQRDPRTGELTWDRTAVGDFDEAQAIRKLQSSLAIAQLRDEGQTLRNRDDLKFKDRWESQEDDYRRWRTDREGEWRSADNRTSIEVANIGAESAWNRAVIEQGGQAGKPPPVGVQKMVGEYTSARDAQDNAEAQLAPLITAIERGDLSFNAASNLRHKAALMTGLGSNAETVLYSQFQTSLEGLRNALLVANKGVQTDGDANRAMAELLAGTGDTASILTNLRSVQKSLKTRSSQAQGRIDELARQYGADVGDSSPSTPRAAMPPRKAATSRKPSVSNW